MPCVRMVNSAHVSQAMVLTLSLGANQVLTDMRIISMFKQIQENLAKFIEIGATYYGDF